MRLNPPGANARQWSDLKRRDWIPLQTTKSPKHDPRNGLLLCSNHRLLFDGYSFFLRLLPNVRLIHLYF